MRARKMLTKDEEFIMRSAPRVVKQRHYRPHHRRVKAASEIWAGSKNFYGVGTAFLWVSSPPLVRADGEIEIDRPI